MPAPPPLSEPAMVSAFTIVVMLYTPLAADVYAVNSWIRDFSWNTSGVTAVSWFRNSIWNAPGPWVVVRSAASSAATP
ncbi:hypothetical protein D3C73_1154570 [compost metagenome]